MEISIFEIRKKPVTILAVLFFVALSVWWTTIFYRGLTEGIENNAFTLIYPLLSLFGGIMGLVLARRWGGFKSFLGSSISLFGLGLLAQFFGQASYAYYIYISGIQVPYPSIGDLGYFGSVVLYIFAVLELFKVIHVKVTLQSFSNKLQAILIPLAMLCFSFIFFLRGYVFDWQQPLKIFLDFGYPLGEATYVSLAILVLLLSRNFLGGTMRKPILFLVFVLIAQYISDFTFLYQASKSTWYVGGINDYMYLVSYFLMTISLLYIGTVLDQIRSRPRSE